MRPVFIEYALKFPHTAAWNWIIQQVHPQPHNRRVKHPIYARAKSEGPKPGARQTRELELQPSVIELRLSSLLLTFLPLADSKYVQMAELGVENGKAPPIDNTAPFPEADLRSHSSSRWVPPPCGGGSHPLTSEPKPPAPHHPPPDRALASPSLAAASQFTHCNFSYDPVAFSLCLRS